MEEQERRAGRDGNPAEDGEAMSRSREDDMDELPERHGPFETDGARELNALFAKGFTVPLALRMNSVYGKFAPREYVSAYPSNVVDHARLMRIAEAEVRIIRGEAKVT